MRFRLHIGIVMIFFWNWASQELVQAQDGLAAIDAQIQQLISYTKAFPNEALAWGKLAVAYQSRDQQFHQGGYNQPKALEAFQTAIKLDPFCAQAYEIYFRMGWLLSTMGLYHESLNSFDSGLLLPDTLLSLPQRARMLEQKGVTLVEMRKKNSSIELFLEALKINPLLVSSHLYLVSSIQDVHYFVHHTVDKNYNLIIDPNYSRGKLRYNNSAQYLQWVQIYIPLHAATIVLEKLSAAPSFRVAIQSLKKDYDKYLLETEQLAASDLVAAIDYNEEFMTLLERLDPLEITRSDKKTFARILYSFLKQSGVGSSQLENYFDSSALTGSIISAHFAKSRILNSLSKVSSKFNSKLRMASWNALLRAHRLQQSGAPPYNPASALIASRQISTLFKKDFWPAGVGHASETPLFIIGFIRSGIGILEMLLHSQNEICSIGEDSIFNAYLPNLRKELVSSANHKVSLKEIEIIVEKYGNSILRDMKNKASRIKSGATKRMLGNSVGKSGDGIRSYIIDRMVNNYKNVGLIHLVYPNAKILHIVRDPMDTIFGCFRHKFDNFGLEWSVDLESIVIEYASYISTVAYWKSVLPNRFIDVRYEDMISNTPDFLERLFLEDLKLPWSSKQLSSIKFVDELSPANVGGWRRYAEHLKPAAELLRAHLLPVRDSLPSGVNWDGIVDYDGYTAFVALNDKSAMGTFVKSEVKGPKWLPHTKFDGVGARIQSTERFVPSANVGDPSENLVSINLANYQVADETREVVASPPV